MKIPINKPAKVVSGAAMTIFFGLALVLVIFIAANDLIIGGLLFAGLAIVGFLVYHAERSFSKNSGKAAHEAQRDPDKPIFSYDDR